MFVSQKSMNECQGACLLCYVGNIDDYSLILQHL